MIAADEDLLICDFAETYGILNWRELPVSLSATLASGFRENSRIKMKMKGMPVEDDTLLLASISDGINMIIWMLSEDGRTGTNRPKSIIRNFIGGDQEEQIASFSSPEEFEAARMKVMNGGM